MSGPIKNWGWLSWSWEDDISDGMDANMGLVEPVPWKVYSGWGAGLELMLKTTDTGGTGRGPVVVR
tara:strand:+ start:116553 stop:116750 length:198 start_codon:yes stop_codon:yes gene_type:complete